jgi:sugar-specific transcriptional regulator TrmB
MVTNNDFLSKLGLSVKQIKLYLDLAAHPDSTVVQLNQRIGEPRSSIYLELERLINRGFIIAKRIDKSTSYKITDPKILKLTLDEEADKLQYLTDHLSSFSSHIHQLATTKEAPRSINLYTGSVGIKQLLWNIIISRSKLVIGFSPGQLENVTDRDFAEKWRQAFRDRGMHNQIIFNQPKPLKWSEVPNFLEKNVEAKTLDENQIKFERMTLIYGDILTVCSLKTDNDQYGIEIHDELLVNSQKQIFNFLWDHVAKKLV